MQGTPQQPCLRRRRRSSASDKTLLTYASVSVSLPPFVCFYGERKRERQSVSTSTSTTSTTSLLPISTSDLHPPPDESHTHTRKSFSLFLFFFTLPQGFHTLHQLGACTFNKMLLVLISDSLWTRRRFRKAKKRTSELVLVD